MTRRIRLVGTAAAVLLLAVSCGGGDDDAEDTSGGQSPEETSDSATTTTEAPTTTLSPEDEVLAAYRAAKDALIAASDPPNPDDPDLLATHAGDTLTRLQAALDRDRTEGVSYVTTIETHETGPPTITGDTAVLEACIVDRSQVIDTVTREPRGEPGETYRLVTAEMQRIDGTWKLVQQEEVADTCTPA